ncbi:hypothetical protein EST92_11635 [Streptomyces sp. TM32]|uniref:hypothetical protein n=1 Tax=Streptomyces sp. TM32 TaxID=1652669 RepID=UPI001011BD4C|nr:hypothetical protein [Streptomyces sp. TM32]RXS84202.1 hypothetical protein EST92_11635 [Streptomyces sp. TM32]
MTTPLDEPLAAIAAALDAIEDTAEQHQRILLAGKEWEDTIRGVRQRRARRLKDEGKTWREVGEVMGSVSPQRAEQISRGV